jgi:hypothetical protein
MIHDDTANFRENQHIDGYVKIDDWWYLVISETTAERTVAIVNLSCELNYFIKMIKDMWVGYVSDAVDWAYALWRKK